MVVGDITEAEASAARKVEETIAIFICDGRQQPMHAPVIDSIFCYLAKYIVIA